MPKTKWTENVIVADAEYIDNVAFNLIVNFERMIGRHIPQADMAQWVECIALDGGCQRSEDSINMETQVILVHDKNKEEMNNFNPQHYSRELNGQAFKGELGEFAFTSIEADEKSDSMTTADIIADVVAATVDEKEVKRVMVIPNLEKGMAIDLLLPVLRHIDRACPEKRVTLFGMEPLSGVPCRSEILGYSLMAALGIKSSELK